jgi:SAM-dependent methyltransferase
VVPGRTRRAPEASPLPEKIDGQEWRAVESESTQIGDLFRNGVAAAAGELTIFLGPYSAISSGTVERLLEPLLSGDADVAVAVVSSRGRTADHEGRLRSADLRSWTLAFRTSLLQSLPLRSRGPAIEVELATKLVKRRFRVAKVECTASDGFGVASVPSLVARFERQAAALRYWIVDDLYRRDRYGAEILLSLERATRFNNWMASVVAPSVGNRVLEIGAGIGNLTAMLLPRERYLATDVDPAYLHYLDCLGVGRGYLDVQPLDVDEPEHFRELEGRFDTVLCLNVLEHVRDPVVSLSNMFRALEPGGRLVLYVPQLPTLFSSLDRALGHRCRYSESQLRAELVEAGFEVESVEPFNRVGTIGWWLNGALLSRTHFGRFQLKAFDVLVPLLRRIDGRLPLPGLGLIAVARRSVRLSPSGEIQGDTGLFQDAFEGCAAELGTRADR